MTHGGARFQRNHVLRIVEHEGYTGYIITKGARSGFIPELQIVEESVYKAATEIVEKSRAANEKKRKLPHKMEGNLLLAGNVYCACCGMRMSGINHREYYRTKADGTKPYKDVAKYFCYAKSQHLRECTGQQLYKADIVDKIVEDIARDMFKTIQEAPKDPVIEFEMLAQKKKLAEKERSLQTTIRQKQKSLDQYDDEIANCLAGNSRFSEEALSRAIQRATEMLKEAKAELAQTHTELVNEQENAIQAEHYYDQF